MVDPMEKYTDESFEAKFPEAKLITIAELKYAYNEEIGGISGNGVTNSWNDTKSVLIGETAFAGQEVYIKGKVMSDDTEGNIYKSLYVQDATSGIEVKLNNNVNVKYKKGTWVYVRLNGLYLGNYRMMLSLGGRPSESWNKAGNHKFYSNSNLELQSDIDAHVFAGESAGEIVVGDYSDWKENMTSVDIITVKPENYTEVFTSNKVQLKGEFYGDFEIAQRELMFGRMIRFEGLQCRYAGSPALKLGENGVSEVYETDAMVSGGQTNQYPSWMYTDRGTPETKPWYNWAFKEEVTGRSLYCSVLFVYDTEAPNCSANGIYALRTSGYSRFARQPICYDGQEATITAIYGIYSQKSDYMGNTDDWATYQLTVNGRDDIVFTNGDAALLTQDDIDRLAKYWYDLHGVDDEKRTGDIYYVDWIDKFDDVVGEE